jgi:tetratricopeptide (TPR) repeat protein
VAAVVREAREVEAAAGRYVDLMQAALARGDGAAAREAAEKAHECDAQLPSPLIVIGQTALAAGQTEEARDRFARAAALSPNFLTLGLLATSLHALGRAQEAREQLAKAVACVPDLPDAQFVLGSVCELLEDRTGALTLYERCLSARPGHARARHRAGLCRLAAGDVIGALDNMRRAMAEEAPLAEQWTDLSAALAANGQFTAAHEAAEMALSRTPSDVKALNNLGYALVQLNRSQEAIPVYAQAAADAPDMPAVRFGLAVALLKAGHFDQGWAEYEWRWRDCQRPRCDLRAPLWLGEPLAGRTILIHAEQGFGDSLQFVRFVPLLAGLGACVVLQVPPALQCLMHNVTGVARVVTRLEHDLSYDFHCPMATLPLRFGARPGRIPACPYLHVPEDDQARQGNALRARATGGMTPPDLVVGIVWSGDPRPNDPKSNLVDRRRSIGLEDFAPLFDVPGIRFVSFQFGAARAALAQGHWPVLDAMDGVTDFADTAARLAGIDLLISVDTSIVHLAGSMNRPVWMLSRFDACWRWLEECEDTPWYPSMRIVRQAAPGDWQSVIQTVRARLVRLVDLYQHQIQAAA